MSTTPDGITVRFAPGVQVVANDTPVAYLADPRTRTLEVSDTPDHDELVERTAEGMSAIYEGIASAKSIQGAGTVADGPEHAPEVIGGKIDKCPVRRHTPNIRSMFQWPLIGDPDAE